MLAEKLAKIKESIKVFKEKHKAKLERIGYATDLDFSPISSVQETETREEEK